MNGSPDRQLLEAVAEQLGVEPSFVEKDWHATRIVAAVAAVDHAGLRLVFSGGTSLSKAYGLIQRFSEDLDFKVLLPESGVGRSVRRGFREAVLSAIRSAREWTIDDADILVGNESRFFRCEVGYSPLFLPSAPLRRRVRLEVTLASPALPPERRALHSFVALARGDPPEVEDIACVAPAETAADKLSALTWRILSSRHDHGEHPVRHLHDLAALEDRAAAHPEFAELATKAIANDARRADGAPGIGEFTPAERVAGMADIVESGPEFRERYRRFVAEMCYGGEGETPTFDRAVAAVRRLGRLIDR